MSDCICGAIGIDPDRHDCIPSMQQRVNAQDSDIRCLERDLQLSRSQFAAVEADRLELREELQRVKGQLDRANRTLRYVKQVATREGNTAIFNAATESLPDGELRDL